MLLNLWKVHTMAYDAIKALNPALQLGLVHQFIEMVPVCKWHYHTAPIAQRITQLFSKQIILDWFTKGTFRWSCELWVPGIEYQSPEKPKLDFLGMNYYSRLVLAPQFKLTGMPGEVLSDTRCDPRCITVPCSTSGFMLHAIHESVQESVRSSEVIVQRVQRIVEDLY